MYDSVKGIAGGDVTGPVNAPKVGRLQSGAAFFLVFEISRSRLVPRLLLVLVLLLLVLLVLVLLSRSSCSGSSSSSSSSSFSATTTTTTSPSHVYA